MDTTQELIRMIMRYILAILITLLLLVIPTAEKAHAADDWYVATDGSNGGAGTIGDPWETIDYAVDNCAAGDTIYVRGGTYNERVTMTTVTGTLGNIITLTNYLSEEVIIDGDGIPVNLYFAGLLHISNVSYITVDGIEVIDSASNGIAILDGSGVDTTNIIIQNCTTRRTQVSGIGVHGHVNGGHEQDCSDITITGNTIVDPNYLVSQEGLSMASVIDFEISNNTIYGTDSDYGKAVIDVKRNSENGIVYGNHIYDIAGPGIYIESASGDIDNIDIYNNFIHDLTGIGSSPGSTFNTHAVGIMITVEQTGSTIDDIDIYNNILGVGNRRGVRIMQDEYGGANRWYQDITIYNNTILNGNAQSITVGVDPSYPDRIVDLAITNNIFAKDSGSQSLLLKTGWGGIDGLTVDYNLYDSSITTAPTTHGANWQDANPGFAITPSTNVNSYKLGAGSAAINNASAVYAPADDYYGTARPQDGADDIGAHEYPGAGPPTPEPGTDLVVFPALQSDIAVVFPLVSSAIYVIFPLLW